VSNKIISSKEEVKNFLSEMKELLTDPGFDVGADLDILMRKKTESPTDPYTTANTLLALDFDKYDVLNQLMSLNVSDYLRNIH